MRNIAIIVPVYNEAKVVEDFYSILLSNLVELNGCYFNIVLVDDGSLDNSVSVIGALKSNGEKFELNPLFLKYNVGHQKAILEGLNFVISELNVDKILVLDGDGEDNLLEIPALLKISKEAPIILVKRGRRLEGLVFQFLYFLYKKLSLLIVGIEFDFGNFSIIDRKVAEYAVNKKFIHYSSFLAKSRFDKKYIKLNKAERIGGVSKMNINSLVLHGLLSWAEFSDRFVLFFVKMTIGLFLIVISLILVIVTLKVQGYASPGWASNLIVSLFNAFLLSFGFVFIGLLLLKNDLLNRE